jgi:hypothetical protein
VRENDFRFGKFQHGGSVKEAARRGERGIFSTDRRKNKIGNGGLKLAERAQPPSHKKLGCLLTKKAEPREN